MQMTDQNLKAGKLPVLRKYYGYDSFRPGQEQLVDGILEGQDVFGIMPTGGGKSICYQVPGLLLPVGMMPKTSWPSRIPSTSCSWPGRKLS